MKYYETIKQRLTGQFSYSELLEFEEWHNMRQKIRSRDSNTCQVCKNYCADDYKLIYANKEGKEVWVPAIYDEVKVMKPVLDAFGDTIDYVETISIGLVRQNPAYIAHVHHKYYILNSLPWDYSNDALILLCHHCHKRVHENEFIKVYRDNSLTEFENTINCERCGGTGFIPDYHYYMNGICFQCDGKGYSNF